MEKINRDVIQSNLNHKSQYTMMLESNDHRSEVTILKRMDGQSIEVTTTQDIPNSCMREHTQILYMGDDLETGNRGIQLDIFSYQNHTCCFRGTVLGKHVPDELREKGYFIYISEQSAQSLKEWGMRMLNPTQKWNYDTILNHLAVTDATIAPWVNEILSKQISTKMLVLK